MGRTRKWICSRLFGQQRFKMGKSEEVNLGLDMGFLITELLQLLNCIKEIQKI